MKKYNYIYKITNLINGKIYIGKHSTNKSGDSYMGSGRLLGKAKSKYGKDAFKKEIIAFTDNEDNLDFLERFYIKKYKSRDLTVGYNLTDGGEGMLGYKHSNETKLKMKHHHYDCSGKNNPMYGRHHTSDAKLKNKIAHLGKPSPLKGTHLDEEHKQKLKEGQQKYIQEFRSGMLGKRHTEQSKQKMSKNRSGKLVGVTNPRYGVKPNCDVIKNLQKYNYCKFITPNGEIKIMSLANAKRWHPDWKFIKIVETL